MDLTLAEELTLLAYDDNAGTSKADSTGLPYGIGGALLAELALRGCVELADDRVRVVDPTPPGEPLLDPALARIAETKRERKPKKWVELLHKGAKEAALDRLVEREVLRRETGKILLVFSRTLYPAADPNPEREVRQRLHDTIVRGLTPQSRTVTLATLVEACGLRKRVFPELSGRALKRRVNELAEGDWAAEATKKAIQAVQAAIAASVAAGAAAATSGGS